MALKLTFLQQQRLYSSWQWSSSHSEELTLKIHITRDWHTKIKSGSGRFSKRSNHLKSSKIYLRGWAVISLRIDLKQHKSLCTITYQTWRRKEIRKTKEWSISREQWRICNNFLDTIQSQPKTRTLDSISYLTLILRKRRKYVLTMSGLKS